MQGTYSVSVNPSDYSLGMLEAIFRYDRYYSVFLDFKNKLHETDGNLATKTFHLENGLGLDLISELYKTTPMDMSYMRT